MLNENRIVITSPAFAGRSDLYSNYMDGDCFSRLRRDLNDFYSNYIHK